MATPFDHNDHQQAFFDKFGPNAPAPITAGQISYLTDLMNRKGAALGKSEADMALIGPWVAGLTKTAASDAITAAKEWLAAHAAITGEQARVMGTGPTPATDAALPGADVVPEGRYAIDTDDGAINSLAFYKVDRPTEGRWAGRVFVKLITGADETRLSWAVTRTVLAKIAADGAQAAMLRYGREIGNCGHCGRQLTNDVSRELGIGPVCRGKMGW